MNSFVWGIQTVTLIPLNFHKQAKTGGLSGTDLPHEQRETPGEIQIDRAMCGKRQMLSQCGIIATYELASHSAWMKRKGGSGDAVCTHWHGFKAPRPGQKWRWCALRCRGPRQDERRGGGDARPQRQRSGTRPPANWSGQISHGRLGVVPSPDTGAAVSGAFQMPRHITPRLVERRVPQNRFTPASSTLLQGRSRPSDIWLYSPNYLSVQLPSLYHQPQLLQQGSTLISGIKHQINVVYLPCFAFLTKAQKPPTTQQYNGGDLEPMIVPYFFPFGKTTIT